MTRVLSVIPKTSDRTDGLENPDLRYYAFGFGKRACPGQYIAKDVLFITVARLLWAFDIKPEDKSISIDMS